MSEDFRGSLRQPSFKPRLRPCGSHSSELNDLFALESLAQLRAPGVYLTHGKATSIYYRNEHVEFAFFVLVH